MADVPLHNGAKPRTDIHPPPPLSNPATDVLVEIPSVAGRRAGETGMPPAAVKAACVVVDVEISGKVAEEIGSDREEERFCRICHLSPGDSKEGSEIIQLGCRCKGELGLAHRLCAEAWFRVRGSRCCEICGASAKNVSGDEDNRLMEERYLNNGNSSESDQSGCWRRQPCCNFLMACMIIALILLWFFRVGISRNPYANSAK
ncbi:hypothetical protein Cni_G23452 [Canna indica]|uniref:RING-CH-type domain-containing protein n=1 Tax=Canna indica TaxID=4628 RepID=A0AAQ3QMH8_9LILI|nr:hypothetical protein Cni_G23452 [Canna indica]